MTMEELLREYEKDIENVNFENVDEFKEFADKEGAVYSKGELEQAWAHMLLRNVYEDDSLDDDALVAVAGGKGDPPPAPPPPAPQINVQYNGSYTEINTGGGSIGGGVNLNQKK